LPFQLQFLENYDDPVLQVSKLVVATSYLSADSEKNKKVVASLGEFKNCKNGLQERRTREITEITEGVRIRL
jgi:hypothetical protein